VPTHSNAEERAGYPNTVRMLFSSSNSKFFGSCTTRLRIESLRCPWLGSPRKVSVCHTGIGAGCLTTQRRRIFVERHLAQKYTTPKLLARGTPHRRFFPESNCLRTLGRANHSEIDAIKIDAIKIDEHFDKPVNRMTKVGTSPYYCIVARSV